MSTVFLHVGQCGNQLGQAFWEEASTSKWASAAAAGAAHGSQGNRPKIRTTAPSNQTMPPTTTGGKVPVAGANRPTPTKIPAASVLGKVPLTTAPAATKGRTVGGVPMALVDGSIPCVMVDAEPKVIRQCLDKKSGSGVLVRGVPKESCIWDRAGRGNNWACGYQHRGSYGCDSGGDLLERVLESVRKVVERCDRFNGFFMFHSIAGGTGSGLGSALLEALRSEYPLPYLVTVTVTPFGSGETPLQHLNSLLCLSWLQSYADAVLLFGNDSVLEQAQKYLGATAGAGSGGRVGRAPGGGTGVSMEEMNGHISSVLCNALMPIWSAKQKTPDMAFQQPWEIIRSLCPDPSTKFITTNHVLFAKAPGLSWKQVTSHLLRHSNLWTRQAAVKPHTTSLALILRGYGLEPFVAQGLSPVEAKLKKAYNTVSWNPFPVDYWMSFEPSLGMGQTKLGTVLANSSVVLGYMGEVWERANAMFRERAYLHWYERYGCERETFQQAFESVQGVMDIYRDTETQPKCQRVS